MSDSVDALVLDLLEWIGASPRPYADVIEAWRTSCPRLPVWEEANARGFVTQQHLQGVGAFVSVSASGRQWLAKQRPSAADAEYRASPLFVGGQRHAQASSHPVGDLVRLRG
jgi:hypothetical protein